MLRIASYLLFSANKLEQGEALILHLLKANKDFCCDCQRAVIVAL